MHAHDAELPDIKAAQLEWKVLNAVLVSEAHFHEGAVTIRVTIFLDTRLALIHPTFQGCSQLLNSADRLLRSNFCDMTRRKGGNATD